MKVTNNEIRDKILYDLIFCATRYGETDEEIVKRLKKVFNIIPKMTIEEFSKTGYGYEFAVDEEEEEEKEEKQ